MQSTSVTRVRVQRHRQAGDNSLRQQGWETDQCRHKWGFACTISVSQPLIVAASGNHPLVNGVTALIPRLMWLISSSTLHFYLVIMHTCHCSCIPECYRQPHTAQLFALLSAQQLILCTSWLCPFISPHHLEILNWRLSYLNDKITAVLLQWTVVCLYMWPLVT